MPPLQARAVERASPRSLHGGGVSGDGRLLAPGWLFLDWHGSPFDGFWRELRDDRMRAGVAPLRALIPLEVLQRPPRILRRRGPHLQRLVDQHHRIAAQLRGHAPLRHLEGGRRRHHPMERGPILGEVGRWVRQHVVEVRSEREDVVCRLKGITRLGIEAVLPPELHRLRAAVARRAGRQRCIRQLLGRRVVRRSEVDDDRLALLGDHDVSQAQVPVEHAPRVHVLQRVEQLAEQDDHLMHRRVRPPHPLPQRVAVHEVQDDVEETGARLPPTALRPHADDVRVSEFPEADRLPPRTRVRLLRISAIVRLTGHLEREALPVLLHLVHNAVAAAAELPDDAPAVHPLTGLEVRWIHSPEHAVHLSPVATA